MSGVARLTAAAATRIQRPGTGVAAFLALLCAITAGISPSFSDGTNWYNIANQTVFVMILAIGLTVVLIAGGIDLSVGSTVGLAGGVVANLMAGGTPMALAFVAALAVGASIGLVNGLLITKLKIPDFIATLAMLGVVRGILFVWTHGIPFIDYMNTTYYRIGGLNRLFWQITIPMIVVAGVGIAVATLLRWTAFGRHVYAVGSNRDAARLSGVRVDRMRIAVYVLSGFLAAIAGILLAGRLTTVQPDMASGYELNAIAAAVMGGAALSGGRGRVFGACVGALTLTVIQNIINISNVAPIWEPIVVGTILLLAVLADRGGALLIVRLEKGVRQAEA